MANHLTKFDTQTAYQQFKSSQDFVRPNVSYCEDNKEVYFNSSVMKFTVTHIIGSNTTITMEYNFIEGMTWLDWINSNYNVVISPYNNQPNSQSWSRDHGTVVCQFDVDGGSSSQQYSIGYNDNVYLEPVEVSLTDTIDENTAYVTILV